MFGLGVPTGRVAPSTHLRDRQPMGWRCGGDGGAPVARGVFYPSLVLYLSLGCLLMNLEDPPSYPRRRDSAAGKN